MLKITFVITRGKTPLILLSAVLFLLGLTAWWTAIKMPTAHAMMQFVPKSEGRHVYLTSANYSPSLASTACASGYRMASFWEIADVSNIRYDGGHPAAVVNSDSGSGPPAGTLGWVRTGYSSSTTATAGTGNCNGWTSFSPSHSGTAVKLRTDWNSATGEKDLWESFAYTCNLTGRVWCVRDVSVVYLPLIWKSD